MRPDTYIHDTVVVWDSLSQLMSIDIEHNTLDWRKSKFVAFDYAEIERNFLGII